MFITTLFIDPNTFTHVQSGGAKSISGVFNEDESWRDSHGWSKQQIQFVITEWYQKENVTWEESWE